MCTAEVVGMDKMFAIFLVLLMCIVIDSLPQPYANDFPYQKYGFNRESSQADTDGTRYLKNNLRDEGGRSKVNTDRGLIYNLDSNSNSQNLQQVKRGGSTDNLTHVQGEDFETDKSHKRKHIKSGFQNSYHKDENGSRSSYYEDSDDKGGKVVYDKRHGTRGDQADSEYTEGLKNAVSKDKYDDRKTGFDNRDLQDRQQSYIEDQGKQHGYVDNYKAGLNDRFEIVRRPHSEYLNHYQQQRLPTRHLDEDFDRYDKSNHWGYNPRLPPPPIDRNDGPIHRNHDSIDRRSDLIGRHEDPINRRPGPIDRRLDSIDRRHNFERDPEPISASTNDFQTRRKITIFEDPRDEYIDPKVDRFHDNGNYMTRSEVTRRFDYGPTDRTSLRLRYRGM